MPALVVAPTLHHARVARACSGDRMGQAPCPCGGWGHDTIHKTWASRYVFAQERHIMAYGTVHLCKTCDKRFTVWNPDSLKHWPLFVQVRLTVGIHL